MRQNPVELHVTLLSSWKLLQLQTCIPDTAGTMVDLVDFDFRSLHAGTNNGSSVIGLLIAALELRTFHVDWQKLAKAVLVGGKICIASHAGAWDRVHRGCSFVLIYR